VPGLGIRAAHRHPALEIDRERQQTVPPPFRHRSNELAGVAFRVPFAGIGISPVCNRVRVTVIKYALDHTGVQEQSLDFMPVPFAPGISRFAVDIKFVTDNGNRRVAGRRRRSRRQDGE
jgi:hypothetical protein